MSTAPRSPARFSTRAASRLRAAHIEVHVGRVPGFGEAPAFREHGPGAGQRVLYPMTRSSRLNR